MLGPLSLLLVSPFDGSFLGVLISRLPPGRAVVAARSECEMCRHTLAPRDLVPLVSYLALRARCRFCGAPIAPFHLAVEMAAIGVVGWAWLVEPDAGRLWADCVFGWMLLALAWIDWLHMMLPDVLTLPLMMAGLGVTELYAPRRLVAHAMAAIGAYVASRALAAGYRALRGREGIGQGNAKLLAAGGAWIGPAALAVAVIGGALAGIAILLVRGARGGGLTMTSAVPFGPGLCLALWLVWVYA